MIKSCKTCFRAIKENEYQSEDYWKCGATGRYIEFEKRGAFAHCGSLNNWKLWVCKPELEPQSFALNEHGILEKVPY